MNNINFYAYLRVSTTKQDVTRQQKAIEEWQKENNINIPKENIFVDYYTGKTFDRINYQKLKSNLKSGDYLIIKEVDRLGRDWTGIKKEWQELQDNKINIIIIDMPILSNNLPSEKPIIEGLDLRLIKEQILSLMCYSAQKEREKISQRTKEGLQAKKKEGIKLGRPTNNDISLNNFIKTLELQVNNSESVRISCRHTKYPLSTFILKQKELKNKYNTEDKKGLLELLRMEVH